MVLILGDTQMEALAQLKAYAEARPFSFEQVVGIFSKVLPPPGDNPKHVVTLGPSGLRIVFSIEQQEKGLTRHASMSLPNDKLPAVPIAYEILDVLGFSEDKHNIFHHLEELPDGGKAINFIEYIKDEQQIQ